METPIVTSAISATTPLGSEAADGAMRRRPVESRDPATGEVWRQYETADAVAVTAALTRARLAQPEWGARSPRERVAVLRRFHDTLYRRRAEIAALVTRESGKPFIDALTADVTVTLGFTNWVSATAPGFLRSEWRGLAGMLMWRKRVRIERKPLGVIGIISPWNYPFFLPASCVLPVLACGNAAIVKPSEFTPGAAAILEELWREAGLPDGILQVVQGDGLTGAALVRSGIDKVMFTGSAASGRKVAVACAEQLIPCSLELGGSDAAIVLADADIQYAADGIIWTRFSNAGQTCVAPKRVFVESAAYDAFVAAAARAVRALTVGPGSSADSAVGPLIRPGAASTIGAQRDDALARGARVVAQSEAPAGDAYFAPTLLVDVDDSMRVMHEETFGPLLPVVRVRDTEEAIARANSTDFGLSASVWTRDPARGVAVARRLAAGTVQINDALSVVGMADLAYGGVKSSGLGRMHGVQGLEDCVQSMPIVDDRFATWHQPWWFPYGARHRESIDSYVRLAHGSGLRERLSGLAGTIRLVLARKGSA